MKVTTAEWIDLSLKVISSDIGITDFERACFRIVKHSDLVQFNTRKFSRNEVNKIANSLYSWVISSSLKISPKMELEREHDLVGRVVTASRLASMLSSDLLIHHLAVLKTPQESSQQRLLSLIEAFVAICFRYGYCADGLIDTFHFTNVIVFVEKCAEYVGADSNDEFAKDLTYSVARTLSSLDPEYFPALSGK
jgi:hypothetical protein